MAGESLPSFEVPSLRSVIDGLPRAVIVTDTVGRIEVWSAAAEELFGWSEYEVVGRDLFQLTTAVHTSAGGADVLSTAVAGDSWTGDAWMARRDATVVRARVSYQPLHDDRGTVSAVVVTAEDVTEQRAAEKAANDLAEQLRVALDAGGLGTWRWDLVTGELECDATAHHLFGLVPGAPDDTLTAWMNCMHPDDRQSVFDKVVGAIETRGSVLIEYRVVWQDGSVHWLRGIGRVTFGADGTVAGAIGCTAEVTEQVELSLERERVLQRSLVVAERERLSRERLEFLATVNDTITNANTRKEAMHRVPRATVPRMGDYCLLFVLPGPHTDEPELEVAHVDPQMRAKAIELRNQIPWDPQALYGIPHVIRTGRTEFYPEVDDALMARPEVSDPASEFVRGLGVRSVISVPLVKRDQVLGAMQFINSDSSRTYTHDDVLLAQAIGSRIAAALDNLRLAEHERMIATTLQAALLPSSLPAIDGVEVAVRYWAAGEGTEVGGDFYDIFDVDDKWAVMMGDVCGTGPVAAATTSLARHTIRASAWHGAGPADVLRELNNAMLQAARATFCTVAYSTLTRVEGGFVLELVCGGHPRPVLCRASGETEYVGQHGTLIGALATIRARPVTVTVGPGDTLVFYTDGVTDVRPPHEIDAATLATTVQRACDGARSAEVVADRLRDEIESVLPISERNDDIALLVIRVSAPKPA